MASAVCDDSLRDAPVQAWDGLEIFGAAFVERERDAQEDFLVAAHWLGDKAARRAFGSFARDELVSVPWWWWDFVDVTWWLCLL